MELVRIWDHDVVPLEQCLLLIKTAQISRDMLVCFRIALPVLFQTLDCFSGENAPMCLKMLNVGSECATLESEYNLSDLLVIL